MSVSGSMLCNTYIGSGFINVILRLSKLLSLYPLCHGDTGWPGRMPGPPVHMEILETGEGDNHGQNPDQERCVKSAFTGQNFQISGNSSPILIAASGQLQTADVATTC